MQSCEARISPSFLKGIKSVITGWWDIVLTIYPLPRRKQSWDDVISVRPCTRYLSVYDHEVMWYRPDHVPDTSVCTIMWWRNIRLTRYPIPRRIQPWGDVISVRQWTRSFTRWCDIGQTMYLLPRRIQSWGDMKVNNVCLIPSFFLTSYIIEKVRFWIPDRSLVIARYAIVECCLDCLLLTYLMGGNQPHWGLGYLFDPYLFWDIQSKSGDWMYHWSLVMAKRPIPKRGLNIRLIPRKPRTFMF